jgi:hypothetical protein
MIYRFKALVRICVDAGAVQWRLGLIENRISSSWKGLSLEIWMSGDRDIFQNIL